MIFQHNLKKSDHYKTSKESTIYTPAVVSEYLFDLLSPYFKKGDLILDPCSGMGSLLSPWKNYRTMAIDSDENSRADYKFDFLNLNKEADQPRPKLVLCNPPFNGYKINKIGSEIWLDKITELFGKNVPLVLFVPMGFRLNSTAVGRRRKKFLEGTYPPITSIISLPRNIFLKKTKDNEEMEPSHFHAEILIFNIPYLPPHIYIETPKEILQKTYPYLEIR